MKYTFRHHFRNFLLFCCCIMLPGTALAETACITPIVTQTYLIEMEAYNKSVRDLLQKNGCILPKVTIFGQDMTFITSQEDQLSKAFLEKSGDKEISKVRASLNASNVRTSALQLQDVASTEKLLGDMRILMNKATGEKCITLNVTDVMEGKSIQTLPLYVDIQARYLAYRQIYLWLMTPNKTVITYPESDDVRINSISRVILNRYTAATKDLNPFSYIKDYKDASLTSCQAQELGFGDIQDSLKNLSDAVLSIGKAGQEFGEAVVGLSTIKFDLNELLGQVKLRGPDGSTIITGQGVQKGEEEKFLRDVAEGIFGIPFDALTEAAEKLSNFDNQLRVDGAPVKKFTFAELQSQIVQANPATGEIKRKSLTDIPVTYNQQIDIVDLQKDKALAEFMAKNYDTLGKYTTTQYFLGKMDQMASTLAQMNNTATSAANDFMFVCQTHLYRTNDDCGEIKK